MDITLNYIEKGTGTPLILLHGNGENLDYFTAQTEYFSKKYRVIAGTKDMIREKHCEIISLSCFIVN